MRYLFTDVMLVSILTEDMMGGWIPIKSSCQQKKRQLKHEYLSSPELNTLTWALKLISVHTQLGKVSSIINDVFSREWVFPVVSKQK